jgi:hypothetical protein
MSRILAVLCCTLAGFLASSAACATDPSIQVAQVICNECNQGQTISSITCSPCSFTGGTNAANIGVTVNLSPSSPAFSGTLTLTGTQTGSGNDADSFTVSGGNVVSNSAGGTIQPGQYGITVHASGSYGGSPRSQSFTATATGPGGSGWQLMFSDEFRCPNQMLECGQSGYGSIVSASAYTWTNAFCSGLSSPSAKGCGTLTVASLPQGITSANCTGNNIGACDVSVAGATNSGGGGTTAANGTFLVVGVPDSTHITLYQPYSGLAATMGGTITVGSGPWAVMITTSCSTPCNGYPNIASNDATTQQDGLDPHACVVSSSGTFDIQITNSGTRYLDASGSTRANYLPPAIMQWVDNTYTITDCRIQTWNNSSGFNSGGFSQAEELYQDQDGKMPPGNNPHPAFFTLNANNMWPSEFDYPECYGSCFGHQWSPGVTPGPNTGAVSGDSSNYHQYGMDISSTTGTWYLDGTSLGSETNHSSGTLWYPIMDDMADGADNTVTDGSTFSSHWSRVYHKVASGACYSTIPTSGSGVVPHTGTC